MCNSVKYPQLDKYKQGVAQIVNDLLLLETAELSELKVFNWDIVKLRG